MALIAFIKELKICIVMHLTEMKKCHAKTALEHLKLKYVEAILVGIFEDGS